MPRRLQGESRPEDLDVGLESSGDEAAGSGAVAVSKGGARLDRSAPKTAAGASHLVPSTWGHCIAPLLIHVLSERAAEKEASRRVSLVPAGYRNWSEVAAALAGNTKREARARAALERERQATLRLGIKAPTPPGGKPPSRRMIRVAANCQRILAEVFSKRAIRDDALYPAGQASKARPCRCLVLRGPTPHPTHPSTPQAIEITEITMTPDLRRAYVLWTLPFPVTSTATARDPAALILEQRRERESLRARAAAADAAAEPGYAQVRVSCSASLGFDACCIQIKTITRCFAGGK